MGINYSFILLCERSGVDAVLTALAEHLAPDDRARVLSALPWRPASEEERLSRACEIAVDARGVLGMTRGDSGYGEHSHCFSLALHVENHHRIEWSRRLEDGRTAIGCMWTTVRAGQRFAAIEMSAATSDMSRLLVNGSDARSVFMKIASVSRARALLFDREEMLLEQLHPSSRWVERPDEERHSFADDYEPDVDGAYREILQAAVNEPS